MKRCSRCGLEKPLTEFHRHKGSKDGYQFHCKACRQERMKEYYQANRDKRLERHKEYRQANRDKVLERQKEYDKKYRQANPEKAAWSQAKHRAKKAGVPFTILPEDIYIPEYCPVLGIKLEPGKGRQSPNSPSVDRIIPELGYVKGNIMVISWRANRIKNDGTLEELRAIVDWLASPLLHIGYQKGVTY